jgi:hypothetical protein
MLVFSVKPDNSQGIVINDSIRVSAIKLQGNKAVIGVEVLGKLYCERLLKGEAVMVPLSPSFDLKIIILIVWPSKVRIGFEVYRAGGGPQVIGKRALKAARIILESF